MIKLAIGAGVVGLGILGSVFQPSWAPDPIPLEAGQTYRTGSPLSKPGALGLFGAIGESIVGGDNFSGGGTAVFDGQRFVDTTDYLGGPTVVEAGPQCPHIEIDGQPACTFQTVADANNARQAAIDALPEGEFDRISESRPPAVVPTCEASQQLATFLTQDDELGVVMVYVCIDR